MGKAKQLMHMLHSRLPSFKVKQSPSPPTSGSSASSYAGAHTSTARLSSSPPPAEYEPYTPPSTPSTAPRAVTRDKPGVEVASKTHDNASLPSSRRPALEMQQYSSPPRSSGLTTTLYRHLSSSPISADHNTSTPTPSPPATPRTITQSKPEMCITSLVHGLPLPSSRQPPLKTQQEYPSSPRSSGSDTSLNTYGRPSHALLSSSPAPPEHDTFTPLTTAPTTPRTVSRFDPEPVTIRTVHGIAVLPCLKEEHIDDDGPRISAHAELAASKAMLDFARKLPLEELSMVGHGLKPREKVIGARGPRIHMAQLPSSPVLRQACGSSVEEGTAASTNDTPTTYRSSPRTLSLSSGSSASTWSFACCSARQIEREHGDLLDDSAECQSHQDANWPDQNGSFFTMSDEDFDALPDYSDIEDEDDFF